MNYVSRRAILLPVLCLLAIHLLAVDTLFGQSAERVPELHEYLPERIERAPEIDLDRPATYEGIDFTSSTVPIPTPATATATETFVVTNTNNSGAGSLRTAIANVNVQPPGSISTITFNIPGSGSHVIELQAMLPFIERTVILDATTQPGYSGVPLITLDGTQASINHGLETIHGLVVASQAPGTVIRGLSIVGFYASGYGIIVDGEGSVVEANYIGLLPDGVTPRPNRRGIGVLNSSVRIGGPSASQRNVISGNHWDGILIDDEREVERVVIQGNYIGINATGTADLGNGRSGIDVRKGTHLIEDNVISGNGFFQNHPGIFLVLETYGTVIVGNRIGTNAAGTQILPNSRAGIWDASPGSRIGGLTEEDRNVISGNNGSGIILAPGSVGATIFGNYIGTNAAGTGSLGNGHAGILAETRDHVIHGNLISGNGRRSSIYSGINLVDNATDVIVTGNRIGTNAAGTAAIPNIGYGITIWGPSGARIGGPSADDRNVISGNTEMGLRVGTPTTGTLVEGNYVGTDISGTFGIGNLNTGIQVTGRDNVLRRNVVSFNGQGQGNHAGIVLHSPSSGNQLVGNFVGTNASGTAALGNTGGGLFIAGTNNVVGGTDAAARNVISGNGLDGITVFAITAPDASNNQILGNYIGVAADGTTALGNERTGISIMAGSDNTVGGLVPGAGNVIANNAWFGVRMDVYEGRIPYRNAIHRNSITHNSFTGIVMGGTRTSNDPDDADDGPNRQQNYPVITNMEWVGDDQVEVSYYVPSAPANTTYPLTVEFFGADESGQGARYFATDTYLSASYPSGKTVVLNVPAGLLEENDIAVATATDAEGNTSEFSNPATLGDSPAFVVTNTNDTGDGSLRWAFEQANGSPIPASVHFNVPGSGPHVITPQSVFFSFTQRVTIDGTTQPGYAGVPVIVIDGSRAGDDAHGLSFAGNASGHTVRGLAVVGYAHNGIAVIGGTTVEESYLGIMPDGTPRGNGTGVMIRSRGSVVQNNVISGNTARGVALGGSSLETADNRIIDNMIGTSPDGNSAIPNGEQGIRLTGAVRTLIEGNTISGNGTTGTQRVGIWLQVSHENVIRGNLIGTNAAGTTPIPNGSFGISLYASANNEIGGEAHLSNVISGNAGTGLVIWDSRESNMVYGNLIGIASDGQSSIPNGSSGIDIVGSSGQVIGDIGIENVIAYNQRSGVRVVQQSPAAPALDNTIRFNRIFSNNLIGIELGTGRTPNDEDDSDEGPNNLQNYPVITDFGWVSQTEVEISYHVPSSPDNSVYPITVDFYGSDGTGQGERYLFTDEYEESDYPAGKSVTFTITPDIDLERDDVAVATATDADGNTSEFSDEISIGRVLAWMEMDSGTTTRLTRVHFVGERHGWAVGHSGTALRTRDGGTTWTTIDLGRLPNLNAVHFTSPRRGWIAGPAHLLRTVDGGDSWSPVIMYDADNPPSVITDVFFIDEQRGWIMNANREVMRTTDGGSTWTRHQTGITEGFLNRVFFIDESTGWIAMSDPTGHNGMVLSSSDGGLTWQSSEFNQGIRSVFFVDANVGYASGSHGNVFKSIDGGRTWSQLPRAFGTVYSVVFSGPDEGWISTHGLVSHTVNGGNTWQNHTIPGSVWVTDLHMESADLLWAVGSEGIIYRYGSPASSLTEPITVEVSAPGLVSFEQDGEETGLSLDLTHLSGSGSITIRAENVAPSEATFDGPEPAYVFPARWVIEASGLHDIEGELAFDTSVLEGVDFDGSEVVVVFRRDLEGIGTFSPLETRIEDGVIYALVDGFSEFVLAVMNTGTSIDGAEDAHGFALEASYPNPFRDRATIGFSLERPGNVRLDVYDLLGRRVATLVDAEMPSGRHEAVFDAGTMPSGMYLMRLTTGAFTATRTALVVR